MEQVDLLDTTFLIPLRIDFDERLRNAMITLKYLLKYLKTNIIILENGPESHIDKFGLSDQHKSNITYIFEKSDNKLFDRMRCINTMLTLTTTPVVVNYDIDVLLPPESYVMARDFVIKGFSIINPFRHHNGAFYVDGVQKNNVEKSLDVSTLDLSRIRRGKAGNGFCVFFDTNIYKSVGGENTNFKAYGPEDDERFYRFSKLGYNILNTETIFSYVFHLEHPRGENSSRINPYFTHNHELYNTIQQLSVDEYKSYVSLQNKKTVVLCLSSFHFNPNKKSKYNMHSAGIISRYFYEYFKSIGYTVEYYDIDYDLIGKTADIFIGHWRTFEKICLQNNFNYKYVYYDTSDLQYKIETVKSYCDSNTLPYPSYCTTDFNKINLQNKQLADKILLVGNERTVSTFGEYKHKIVKLNYASPFDIFKTNIENDRKIEFVHSASDLGPRKGLHQLLESWKQLDDSFIINIIGKLQSDYWKNRVNTHEQEHKNLKFWGWVDSDTDKYKQIIQNCRYAYFPTIEEGQVGSVLDMISLGCIPITTIESGIDENVLEHCYVVDLHNTEQHISVIKQLCNQTYEEYKNKYQLLKDAYIKYQNKQYFFNKLNEHFTHLKPFQYVTTLIPNLYSIVLTVFNKDWLIEKVLDGIFQNTVNMFELIIIIDGCTDNSEKVIQKYLDTHTNKYMTHYEMTYCDDIFETRANNIGCKMAHGEYIVIVQDDHVINEKNWLKRQSTPFRKFKDVFCVTSQTAHNYNINLSGKCQEGKHEGNIPPLTWCSLLSYDSVADKSNTSRDIFSVRDSANRGPLMFLHSRIRELGYFDEIYYEQTMDEHDLCYRAWIEHKWVSGIYWIDRISEPNWGSTRIGNTDSPVILKVHHKNSEIIMKRYLQNGYEHHNEDRVCVSI